MQREENMNAIKKPIPINPCPALNKKLKVCGKEVVYGHKGCKTHPQGVGLNKDVVISMSQAHAWLTIEEFFQTPEEFKNILKYETYRKDKHITDVVVFFVPTLSIARTLTNKIGSSLEIDNTILTYCLDRLFNIFWLYSLDDWVPELNNVGTDVDGFTPQHKYMSYCIDRIKYMTLCNTVDAVKFVLKSEYGYVNKFVKDAENIDLLELKFEDTIVSPGKPKINRGDVPYSKLWHETIKQNVPIGIVYKDDKFVVIDGYIRGISAMRIGSDREFFILMS